MLSKAVVCAVEEASNSTPAAPKCRPRSELLSGMEVHFGVEIGEIILNGKELLDLASGATFALQLFEQQVRLTLGEETIGFGLLRVVDGELGVELTELSQQETKNCPIR